MSEQLIITPKFKQWMYLRPDDAVVQELVHELNIHPTICKLLALRGITSAKDVHDFFHPSLHQLINPFLMKDMEKSVKRIHQAVLNQEKILIYGDYDVDGITSVSMFYIFFKEYTQNIGYYVPDRNKEGCGISFEGIEYAQQNGYSLIISLDCGTKDFEQVELAQQKNIDIIICDHHLPENELPNAFSILNPQRKDCNYPYKQLSACGVGFKLLQAYTQTYDLPVEKLNALLDFVAISIAADTVSVIGENRILAYFGMKIINQQPRVGIKAILDKVRKFDKLELMDLVFTVSPRINAAGRILHASYAVELLIEEDYPKALKKAQLIHDNNYERQVIDKDITSSALDIIEEEDYDEKKAIIIFQKDWHQGVIAIVASRLVDKFYKPTVILTESNGWIVGSARSVPGFDIYSAISKCSPYLMQFGGHKYACGFTMKEEFVERFISQLEHIIEDTIDDDQLKPKIEVDDVIELEDINEDFFRWIEKMEPFGNDNLKPIFVTKDVKDNGNNGFVGKSHLKVRVSKNSKFSVSGIGYGMWDYIPYLRSKEQFHICYQLFRNEWRGKKSIDIRLKDLI